MQVQGGRCVENEPEQQQKPIHVEFAFLRGDPGTTGTLPCAAQIKHRLLGQPEEDKDNVLLLLAWM